LYIISDELPLLKDRALQSELNAVKRKHEAIVNEIQEVERKKTLIEKRIAERNSAKRLNFQARNVKTENDRDKDDDDDIFLDKSLIEIENNVLLAKDETEEKTAIITRSKKKKSK